MLTLSALSNFSRRLDVHSKVNHPTLEDDSLTESPVILRFKCGKWNFTTTEKMR